MGLRGARRGDEDRLRQHRARLPRGGAGEARPAEARARVRRAQHGAREDREAGPRPADGARARERHHPGVAAPRQGAPARRHQPQLPAPAARDPRGPEPAQERGARGGAGAGDEGDQPDRRAGEVRPGHPGSRVRERSHRHHGQRHPPALGQVSYTLREIVARLGGEALGDSARPLKGMATLDSAGPDDLAFLANPKYRSRLAGTRAGAVIVGPGDRDAATIPRIVSDNPYAYYARAVTLFNPESAARPGIHPSAVIEPGATVDASAEIAAHAVIRAQARICAARRIAARP